MKKVSVLLLVLLILPFLAACSLTEKARVDDEVRRLCAIDGGVKVYEKVRLPAERFDKYGHIRVLSKRLAKPEDEFYYESSTRYLKRGNPELLQLHTLIYRKLDNRLLGEGIVYMRRGGDWHPSGFHCPKDSSLESHIFVKSNGD